jgi:hypothetical protein
LTGIIDLISRSAARDLDRRVHGAAAEADGQYEELVDDADLLVRARLSADGPLALEVHNSLGGRERREEGSRTLEANVGPGKNLRGGVLTVSAEAVHGAGADNLVALTVELSQSGGASGPQTYSVEARLDGAGHARLRISVTLGDDDEAAAAVAGS